MHSLDWRLLESRYVVKDNWLSLRMDKCQMPDGRIMDPCYVLEYRPWVNVVALTKERQVVLVRQYRHGIQETILELPGGTTDAEDASPLMAVKRELLEETGYSSEYVFETGKVYSNPASHTNATHSFLAVDVERVSEPHLDDLEQLEVVLMPLEEVVALAKASGFSQALHVSSLFFALSHLGRIL